MASQARRILVTGGAGAIGGNLVRALLKEPEARVVVVDNLTSGRRESLPGGPRLEFVEGDVADAGLMGRVMRRRFAEIYHLAAFFANQNSCEHPVEDFRSNALGTLLLLDAARAQPALESILLASTSCLAQEVATAAKEGFSTPYMASKFVGEIYGRYYRRAHGLPLRIVRYFNAYGPGERPGRYRNVIINFIDRALRREPLLITGTGRETRDFTFVEDIVSGTIAVARSRRTLGKLYDIGTGRETRIRSLAEEINRLAGNHVPLRLIGRRGWDKTMRRRADTGPALRDAGFRSRVALTAGLERTIAWYRSLSTGR